MFHVCLSYVVLSIPCSLVITCLEMIDFLALLCVVLSCIFDSLPYGVLGQVLCLIVSIPGLLKCGAFQTARIAFKFVEVQTLLSIYIYI